MKDVAARGLVMVVLEGEDLRIARVELETMRAVRPELRPVVPG
jgi:hypothetical protein